MEVGREKRRVEDGSRSSSHAVVRGTIQDWTRYVEALFPCSLLAV
jgi:hypothetical protein